MLGCQPGQVGAGGQRGEAGRPRPDPPVHQALARAVQRRRHRPELAAVGHGPHHHHLVGGIARERLSQRKQPFQRVVGEGDDEDRAVGIAPDRLCGGGGALRSTERRVVAQNGPLELLQRAPRLDAELLDQRRAQGAEGLERLRLAAASVEGEHLQPAQALPERVRGHQRVDLPQHGGVVAGGQLRLHAALDGEQPQLVEARGDVLEEGLADEIPERGAPSTRPGPPRAAAPPRRAAPPPTRGPLRRRAARSGAGRGRRGRRVPGIPCRGSRWRRARGPSGGARRSPGPGWRRSRAGPPPTGRRSPGSPARGCSPA